jgi:hypothetical protein
MGPRNYCRRVPAGREVPTRYKGGHLTFVFRPVDLHVYLRLTLDRVGEVGMVYR